MLFSSAIVIVLLAARSSNAERDEPCFFPICIVDKPCFYKLPPPAVVAPGQHFDAQWFRIEGNVFRGIPSVQGLFYLNPFLEHDSGPILVIVVDEATFTNDARSVGECMDKEIKRKKDRERFSGIRDAVTEDKTMNKFIRSETEEGLEYESRNRRDLKVYNLYKLVSFAVICVALLSIHTCKRMTALTETAVKNQEIV